LSRRDQAKTSPGLFPHGLGDEFSFPPVPEPDFASFFYFFSESSWRLAAGFFSCPQGRKLLPLAGKFLWIFRSLLLLTLPFALPETVSHSFFLYISIKMSSYLYSAPFFAFG